MSKEQDIRLTFFIKAAIEVYEAAKEVNDNRATQDITRLDLALMNFKCLLDVVDKEQEQ
jgi:hypothetical protein